MSVPPQRDPLKRLVAVTLDEASIDRSNREVEHERAAAIADLLEDNTFHLPGHDGGPYALLIRKSERRLVLDIRHVSGVPLVAHHLSLAPFRRIVRDYFLICDSYRAATRAAQPARIEAIDMGRRGLHDEGARILHERIDGKIETDFATARRLFTLICALHWKG